MTARRQIERVHLARTAEQIARSPRHAYCGVWSGHSKIHETSDRSAITCRLCLGSKHAPRPRHQEKP